MAKNIDTMTGEELLLVSDKDQYASSLRWNYSKLEELSAAGLTQLREGTGSLDFYELGPWMRTLLKDKRVQDILTNTDVSSVCGHIFKKNEAVVRCIDCAADPTCVKCIECFQNSTCTGHNYTIVNSGGGGMCDCGDPTAYKPESFCNKHAGASESFDPLSSVPEGESACLSKIFDSFVRHICIIVSVKSEVGQTKEVLTRPAGDRDSEFESAESSSTSLESAVEVDPEVTAKLNTLESYILLYIRTLTTYASLSETARRFISNSWIKVMLPNIDTDTPQPFPNHTNLEIFMLFTCRFQKGSQLLEISLKLLSHCVVDDVFKTALGAVFCKYSELLSQTSNHSELAVQLFTNPVVVENLSLHASKYMNTTNSTDTIAHRVISSIYSSLYKCRRVDNLAEDKLHTIHPVLFQISPDYKSNVVCAFFDLGHCLITNNTVGLTILISRTALRAILTNLQILSGSSDVIGVTGNVSRYFALPIFLSFNCSKILHSFNHIFCSILNSYRAERDSKIKDAGKLLENLRVNPVLLEVLQGSRRLDPIQPDIEYLDIPIDFYEKSTLGADETSIIFPADLSEEKIFTFINDVMDEVVWAMEPLTMQQKKLFCSNNGSIVLKRESVKDSNETRDDTFSYDTFAPCNHSVSMFNLVARLYATLLRCIECSLSSEEKEGDLKSKRLYEEEFSDDVLQMVSAVESNGSGVSTLYPLKKVLRAIWLSGALLLGPGGTPRHQIMQYLFDSLIMPSVLASQVEKGLWRTVEQDYINQFVQTYLHKRVKCGIENDIFVLQTLTMVMKPQDFATQALQRFLYVKPLDEKKASSKYRKMEDTEAGLESFLRFMLTMITDSNKATPKDNLSDELIANDVANFLSKINSAVFSDIQSLFDDNTEEDDVSATKKAKFVQKQKEVLKKITVVEKGRQGNVFKMASTKVWREHVNIYSVMHRSGDLNSIYTSYHSLVTRENVEKGTRTSPSEVHVPPTTLQDILLYHELIPYTRALLHTDAVLDTALFLLIKTLFQSNEKCKDNETESCLLNAVTTLYLCVKDCVALSDALGAASSTVSDDEQDMEKEPKTVGAPSDETIQWDAIQAYLRNKGVFESSFTDKTVKSVLRIPAISGDSLLEKLKKTINETFVFSTGKSVKHQKIVSLSSVLHELRLNLKAKKIPDRFSVLEMIEYVLRTCGLATFGVEETVEETRKKAEADQAALERKAKQRAIMEKMRMRTKASLEVNESKYDDKAASEMTQENNDEMSGFIKAHLLAQVSLQKCCICQVHKETPLFLLGNVSCSGVLNTLVPGSLPDDRRVHAHYYTCGHVAHKACVDKLIVTNSRRGYSRNHGVTEIPCPICLMISNSLAPVPIFDTTLDGPSLSPATVSSTTSLEEIQSYTLKSDLSLTCVDIFHNVVCNFNVGTSVLHDGPSLLSPEKEDELQKNNEAAWLLSETIRVSCIHAKLIVEKVKAGHRIHYRDLLAEFALLVSVRPDTLKTHENALRANYSRNNEVLPLLVLDCLLSPAGAASRLSEHIRATICTVEDVKTTLSELLCVEAEEEKGRSLSSAQRSTLVAIWSYLSLISLLKIIICDDVTSHFVKVNSCDELSFLFINPEVLAETTQLQLAVRNLFEFVMAASDSIEDETGMSEDERRKVRCQILLKSMEKTTDSAAAAQSLLLHTDAFENPSQWVSHILDHFLHLPEKYTSIITSLTRSKCSANSPILCCSCGAFFDFREGMLNTHARECVGATLLLLDIHNTGLMVLNNVDAKLVTALFGLYVDENEEPDPGLRRGKPLARSPEEGKSLVKSWILNLWAVESFYVKRTLGSILLDRV